MSSYQIKRRVVVAKGHETNVEVVRFYFLSNELVSSSQLNRLPDNCSLLLLCGSTPRLEFFRAQLFEQQCIANQDIYKL